MTIQADSLVEIITQNINTIVIVINRRGELVYVSNSVERILGYMPEELLGEYWWRATRKDENSALEMLETFKDAVRNNRIEELSTERLLFDASNNKKWILWNSSLDEYGNVVSVGYDITNRKKNEQRLKRSLALLKNRNKEVFDSLNYAQSIQHSILPNPKFYTQYFRDGFVLYQPKDIVSGDFFWYYEKEGLLYVACIDCTGHGVPGALMTILANNLLKNVVKHQHLQDPAEILHALDILLYDEFNRNAKVKRSDGMDISLCIIDPVKKMVQFSGALHSLFVHKRKEDELLEYKGKRYPIGLYHDVVKVFETEEIQMESGDRIFLFTDGIVDQFGGEQEKKFTKKRFRENLPHENASMEMICRRIEENFLSWKGKYEQTDDVLVIGLEL
ncbi:MAG: histidine kinase [Crocinitomicaceae bacterium]|jgi:PAS domain S-box-containing protein|nr:histidine kinase [Crocinitomicaceae bacterium]